MNTHDTHTPDQPPLQRKDEPIRVYDPRALKAAFRSYLGTTRLCAARAACADLLVTCHSTMTPEGHRLVDPGPWMAAMKIMNGLPAGGRWVNEARRNYRMWLTKALTHPLAPDDHGQLPLFPTNPQP